MSEDPEKERDVHTIAATAVPLAIVPAKPRKRELESLFLAHNDQILRTAYRVTGSATDAEDVLQTIFMRLMVNQDDRGLQGNPGGYLRRAAVNASLDLIRNRSHVHVASLDALDREQSPVSPDAGPEQAHANRELQRLVRQAVARLGERVGAMFALRYFEGYKNSEIAELFGTSQLVVAVSLHRARTRLRREIGQYLEKHDEKRNRRVGTGSGAGR